MRGEPTVGRDVFIDVGAVFEGVCELGDRVRIEPYCVIANSKLGAGSRASAQRDRGRAGRARLRDRSVARLRPGANLVSDVKVGNRR